jgi:AbrB family looped-hinge helix DNA binding protein
MLYEKARVDDAGRILIPSKLRKMLGMKKGDVLTLVLDPDQRELRVFTVREAIRRAQATMRKYVPEGVSLSEELIAERRAEAAREEAGD